MMETKNLKSLTIIGPANSQHIVKWANKFNELNYKVHVISSISHKQSQTDLFIRGVKLSYLPIPGKAGFFLNWLFLRILVHKFPSKSINVHYASSYGTLARLAFPKRKYLLNVWGSDINEFPKKSQFFERILTKNLKHATEIAATSHALSIRTKVYTKKKIHITPFGVDTKKFTPQPSDKIKSTNLIVIGCVKSLDKKYGIEYLIRAFHQLDQEHSFDVQLHIYGAGPEMKNLKQLTCSLDIINKVIFKGSIPNNKVPAALKTFDIFCTPSICEESFGVSLIEAMSCNIPVIGTNVDGFSEIIEDGIDGFLAQKENVESLKNAFVKIIDHKNISDIKMNARKKVVKYYNLDSNATILAKILSNL